MLSFFFFFNDTATTEIYTLSLHDALPISRLAPDDPEHQAAHAHWQAALHELCDWAGPTAMAPLARSPLIAARSEEHTSELQSRLHLVCRLLLEKKKKEMEHDVRKILDKLV